MSILKETITDLSRLPYKVKQYLLFHSLIAPFMIVGNMLIIYLFNTGYNVFQVGILFSVINIFDIVVHTIFGKKLDINRNKSKFYIFLDLLVDGFATMLLFFAYSTLAPFVIMLYYIIKNVFSFLGSTYSFYEYHLFPEKLREKIYAYHFMLPEITQLITFPLWGVLFSVICSTPKCLRIGFLGIGIAFVMLAFVSKIILEDIPSQEEGSTKENKAIVEKLNLKYLKDIRFLLLLSTDLLLLIGFGIVPSIVLIDYILRDFNGNLLTVVLVENALSIGTIITSYLIKNAGKEHRFSMLILSALLFFFGSLLTAISKRFYLVLIAFLTIGSGNVIWHTFYQSYLFSFLPEKSAGVLLGMLNSLRKVLAFILPTLSGYIALYISPKFNYIISSSMFLLVFLIFIILKEIETKSI